MRALALLDGQTAPVRLALSRKNHKGRMETQGALLAHARLVRDKDSTRKEPSVAPGVQTLESEHVRPLLQVESGRASGETTNVREGTNSGIGAGGYITFSGLTIHDLPQSEGLMFGGGQDPYVVLSLGSTTERSTTVARVGKLLRVAVAAAAV